jgi:hypothetical protein
VRKQVEGDNRERRQRAREARSDGRDPSAAGVTTGASKQRTHRQGGESHDDKVASLDHGKQDEEHRGPDTRPGSTRD